MILKTSDVLGSPDNFIKSNVQRPEPIDVSEILAKYLQPESVLYNIIPSPIKLLSKLYVINYILKEF
jgi:hypothetical protein